MVTPEGEATILKVCADMNEVAERQDMVHSSDLATWVSVILDALMDKGIEKDSD